MTSTAGGGVAIYVRKGLKSKVVARSAGTGIEYLFIEIFGLGIPTLVGVVYRPPGVESITSLDSLFSTLSSSYNNIIILGDFNHNLLDDNINTMVTSFLAGFNLHVIHNQQATHFMVNKRDSLLDYIVVSFLDRLSASGQFWVPNISHHACILASFDLKHKLLKKSFQFRDYNSIDVPLLTEAVSDKDFSLIYSSNDVDTQVASLNAIILELFYEFVPLRTVKCRNDSGEPPWYTSEVKLACQLRDLAFKAYRLSHLEDDWKIFCKHRNRANQTVKKSKQKYGCKLFKNCQSNGEFWRKVDELGVLKEKSFEDIQITADNFCSHFAAVQSERPLPRTDISLDEPNCPLVFQEVNDDDIVRAVYLIKSNAVGVDMISLKFLKIILPSIIEHLKYIVTLYSLHPFFLSHGRWRSLDQCQKY